MPLPAVLVSTGKQAEQSLDPTTGFEFKNSSTQPSSLAFLPHFWRLTIFYCPNLETPFIHHFPDLHPPHRLYFYKLRLNSLISCYSTSLSCWPQSPHPYTASTYFSATLQHWLKPMTTWLHFDVTQEKVLWILLTDQVTFLLSINLPSL